MPEKKAICTNRARSVRQKLEYIDRIEKYIKETSDSAKPINFNNIRQRAGVPSTTLYRSQTLSEMVASLRVIDRTRDDAEAQIETVINEARRQLRDKLLNNETDSRDIDTKKMEAIETENKTFREIFDISSEFTFTPDAIRKIVIEQILSLCGNAAEAGRSAGQNEAIAAMISEMQEEGTISDPG